MRSATQSQTSAASTASSSNIYLNLVLEYMPETVYSVARKWQKSKVAMPVSHTRMYVYQLCRALGHIHAAGICHRDVKPQNLLLDPERHVVKLIDFGIAKPQAIDDTDTHPGPTSLASLSFTPGFAAPERSKGAAANTLSDIYSLGKLLEALLENTPANLDLAAIVKQATANEPGARYPSVSAMSDDIRNYRTGYPVDARRSGPLYNLKKYFARRRLLVSAGALSVLALTTALGVTLVQYQRAEAERFAADQRFEDVRELATFMMFDLYDELEKAPGNTKAIEMLANRSQSYLESLEMDDRASLDVKIETGVGFKRLADILGNPKNQNLGQRTEAGNLLDRAEEHLENLLRENPENAKIRRSLADTKFANAVHKYVSDDDSERAHELAKQATALFEPFARAPEADYDDRSNFIRAKMMSAVPLPWIGRDQEGIAILRNVRSEAQNLVESDPENLAAKNLLGSMTVELARALVRYENNSGEPQDTLPLWDDAIDLRLQVYQADPDDVRPYRSLLSIYSERSAAYRGVDRYAESLEDLEAAERIGVELLEIDPDDSWLQRMIQGAREERIRTLTFAGQHDDAVQLVEELYPAALAEYETYFDNPGQVREWGYTQIIFANAYMEAERMQEGCEILRSARDTWTRVDKLSGISETDQNVSIHNLEILEARCAS
ncbi:MAG: protein kinase [Pseudomonadota bacterium]